MKIFLYYLLEAMVCSGILYLWYLLVMRNKAFHQWNRFYLLTAVILSLVLPLLSITIRVENEYNHSALDILAALNYAERTMQSEIVLPQTNDKWQLWLTIVYVSGCAFFLTALLRSLLALYRMITTSEATDFSGTRLVQTTAPGAPFSFFHYIFWNPAICLRSPDGRRIFQHELVHVEEKHSRDKLFLQIIQVFCWYNPFLWLLKRELHCIHEFIADKKSVGEEGSAAFASMILQAAYPGQYNQLVNTFLQTSIKRRMTMLTKKQTPMLNYVSRITALPLLAFTAMAFTVQVENNRPTEQTMMRAVAESQPTALTDTLPRQHENIDRVYMDKPAKKVKIINKEGADKEMKEKELQGKGELPGNGKRQKISVSKVSEQKDKPLFIVDGEEYKKDVDTIDPNTIESVNVLKGESAVAIYGEKGRKGVVEIKLKKQKATENL